MWQGRQVGGDAENRRQRIRVSGARPIRVLTLVAGLTYGRANESACGTNDRWSHRLGGVPATTGNYDHGEQG